MDFLDDTEKRYIQQFGEPVIVGHGFIKNPNIDISVFKKGNDNVYLNISKGMSELGLQEWLK